MHLAGAGDLGLAVATAQGPASPEPPPCKVFSGTCPYPHSGWPCLLAPDTLHFSTDAPHHLLGNKHPRTPRLWGELPSRSIVGREGCCSAGPQLMSHAMLVA